MQRQEVHDAIHHSAIVHQMKDLDQHCRDASTLQRSVEHNDQRQQLANSLGRLELLKRILALQARQDRRKVEHAIVGEIECSELFLVIAAF